MSMPGVAVMAGAVAGFQSQGTGSLVAVWLAAAALVAAGYLLCDRTFAVRVRPVASSASTYPVGRYLQLLGVLAAMYALVVTVVSLSS